MAGDWIKMRGNLWDDPRVGSIVDATEATEAAVIGALYWLWATADQHTEDGFMPGLTLRQIDRKTGVQGFASALCNVGWLSDSPDGVTIENFNDHNGASAKRRCTDAQRKAGIRSMSASEADKSRTDCGQNRQSLGAREEKRREEKETPQGFALFWSTWPITDRKQAKGKCLDAWKKASAERDAAVVVAHVERMAKSPEWLKDGGQYIPAPLVYLNQRRWEGAEAPIEQGMTFV